ncbi:MAG: cytochrome bc1 complex diheme cytochrome c subunit, partial [Sciscionella sp.]
MTSTTPTSGKRKPRRSKMRRRVSSLLAIGVGLVAAGALYSAFAPTPQTAHADQSPAMVRNGQQIYDNTCISCHGSNLQGVQDRGPALLGVGSAAVYFQTSTGRMPAASQSQQIKAKPRRLSASQIDDLMAYIESRGGGPQAPNKSDAQLAQGDSAQGGVLFRLNCASCHNFTGKGGALSSGKFAPSLNDASSRVIYTAMQSGPQNMPKFSDRQLTPQEKQNIIAYLKS